MSTKRAYSGALAGPSKRQASLKSFFGAKLEPVDPAAAANEHVAVGDGTRVEPDEPVKLEAQEPVTASTFKAYPAPPSPVYNHPIAIVPPAFRLSYHIAPKPNTSQPDLNLLSLPSFIAPACAPRLFKYLLDAMPWYRVKYTVRGIHINTPRWTTVFGKDCQRREWTGYKCRPRAIPPVLLDMMAKVQEVTGEDYNFVLVNYYASGTDSISYHSDSEHFLGPEPCIASLSLGAPRDFHLRHKEYKARGIPVQKFVMHDGDMVVMRGKTQERWEHAVPKRAKAEGRINITFRKAVVKYGTENYNTYNIGAGPMYRSVDGAMVEQASAIR